MNPVLLAALLLALAAVLLLLAARQLQARDRALLQRLGFSSPETSGGWHHSLSFLGKLRWSVDGEVPRLLDQLGWQRPMLRARFFAAQLGLPVAVFVVLVVRALLLENVSFDPLMTLIAVALAFLVPKRLLVRAVENRRRQLADEVSTMLPLLRMFFEVGMTVEQALRILMVEGEKIVPELARELRVAMQRVDGGLELSDELQNMSELLQVPELEDTVGILRQLLRQGGGALASLRSLKELMDERRMTALQEHVSKLSAKMSGVMVAFLLPALLIVLAGPGFIAVMKALGG